MGRVIFGAVEAKFALTVTKRRPTVTVAKTAKLANAINKILSTDVPTADEQVRSLSLSINVHNS